MGTEIEYRGILADVVICEQGRASATLVSQDNYAGEPGRHSLGGAGGPMHTSLVLGFDVVDGQLVMETRNSNYIIEGKVTTYGGFVYSMQQALQAASSQEEDHE